MNPRDFIPTAEQIKAVQGLEAELLQRRFKGKIGFLVGLGGALLQVVAALYGKEEYAKNIGEIFTGASPFNWRSLVAPQAIGFFAILLGFGIYFIYRQTSLLAKESREPFQYTFWIEQFSEVTGTPCDRLVVKSKDRLQLFHYDLMERVSLRIRRLSLLNVEIDVPEALRKNFTSHIHIKGNFAIREVTRDKWVLQIMPRIRIGPLGRPEVLADPIRCDLTNHPADNELEAEAYNQLVERVYSIVASEIYKQIRSDLKTKSTLFPTNYLRAVALYHEAVDFERSNTVDAYDYAIQLYRESKHYFDIRWWGGLSRALVKWPILWRLSRRSLLADSGTRIGLARSLIYRKVVSALSGRNQNVLFEIPAELNRVIRDLTNLQNRRTPKWKLRPRFDARKLAPGSLVKGDRYQSLMGFLTFPVDSALKRGRRDFDREREVLSSAYAVAALAYCYLDALASARRFLSSAKATDPAFSQTNPLWFLAAGEIQTDINKKLLFLKQATELSRDFEIAQFRFAFWSEMRLRIRGEIRKERVEGVIQHYADVLTINPGNLGALLAQGYLWWLLREWDRAEKKFKEGCETRAIVRQTFIGEFLYGLGRIAVEKGELNSAYEFYAQAIFADPEVAAYAAVQSRNIIQSKYAFITRDILDRYEEFLKKAELLIDNGIKKAKEPKPGDSPNPEASEPAGTSLLSFYGNFLKKAEMFVEKGIQKGEDQKPEDSPGQEVSERTLKSLRSFILNDYGNACLNYFHRFGDLSQLRKAIATYEAAIDNDRENFVAYYNLDNAYGWLDNAYGWSQLRGGRINNPLENAEKLAPAWPAILIASAQSQLAQAREGIRKKSIEVETREKELIEETLKVIRQELQDEMSPTQRPESLEVVPAPAVGFSDLRTLEPQISVSSNPASTPESKSLPLTRVFELMGKLEELHQDVQKSTRALGKVIFPAITSKKIMPQTKWASVDATYDGGGVSELLKSPFERDRMNEDDIGALQVWAEVLSTNTESKEALLAAEKLCRYVLTYYREHFAALKTLSSIHAELEKLGSPRLRSSDLKDDRKLVARLLNESDPIGPTLRSKFSADGQVLLERYSNTSLPEGALKRALLVELNRILADESLHKEQCFSSIKWRLQIRRLVLSRLFGTNSDRPSRPWWDLKTSNTNTVWLNRQLLRQVFPTELEFGQMTAEKELEDYKSRKAKYDVLLSRIICNWLAADPIHFGSLKWATEFTNVTRPARQLRALKEAIRRQEQDGAYRYLMGNFYRKQLNNEEAATCYQKASQLSRDPIYFNSLGEVFHALKKFADAVKAYEEAIKLDQKSAIYRFSLAATLTWLKQWDRAIETCEQGKELEPQHASYLQILTVIYQGRGAEYLSKGDYPAALPDLEKAVELDPKTASRHLGLALGLSYLKEWDRALEACKEAKELEPQNADHDKILAAIHCARGEDYASKDDPAAVADFKKACALNDSARSRFGLAAGLARQKDWPNAIAACEQGKKLEPQNSSYASAMSLVYWFRGTDDFHMKDYPAAVAAYEKAIEFNPDAAANHLGLALVLDLVKDWPRAIAACEKVKELEPQNSYGPLLAGVYSHRGAHYFAAGNYQDALADYETAIALDDHNADSHAMVAKILWELKQWQRAMVACHRAEELEPDGLEHRQLRKDIFSREGDEDFMSGNFKAAAEKYEQATLAVDGDDEIHSKLALALESLSESSAPDGNLDKAIVALQKAIDLQPDNVDYPNRMAHLKARKAVGNQP